MSSLTAAKGKLHINRENAFGYLLLIPSIIIFAVFTFWPFIYTIYLSFFEWNMISPTKEFVGLKKTIQKFLVIQRPIVSWEIRSSTLFYC